MRTQDTSFIYCNFILSYDHKPVSFPASPLNFQRSETLLIARCFLQIKRFSQLMGRPWKLAFVNEKKPKIGLVMTHEVVSCGLSWHTRLWLQVCRDTRGCDFRSRVTRGCDFRSRVTRGCDFRSCVTRGCDFRSRDTRGCDFRSRVTRGCDFRSDVTHEVVSCGLSWHTKLWLQVWLVTRSCDFRSRVTRGCDFESDVTHEVVSCGLSWHTKLWLQVSCHTRVWRVTRGCELWSVVTHEGVTSALSCHGSLRIALSPIISLGKCARCLGAWLQLRNPFRANLREAVVSHNVYVFPFNVLFVNTCNIYVQMVY